MLSTEDRERDMTVHVKNRRKRNIMSSCPETRNVLLEQETGHELEWKGGEQDS